MRLDTLMPRVWLGVSLFVHWSMCGSVLVSGQNSGFHKFTVFRSHVNEFAIHRVLTTLIPRVRGEVQKSTCINSALHPGQLIDPNYYDLENTGTPV